MAKAIQRHAFVQTNGRPVYLYDHDIAGVASVVTEKHGACLILRMKGLDDIWIRDDERHRTLLMMATQADEAALVKTLRSRTPS